MSRAIALLDPDFRPLAEEWLGALQAAGARPTVTSTFRSTAEQTRLYKRFLNGQSAFPVAPPGTSLHEYGFAIDTTFPTDEEWNYAIEIAAQFGLKWGGDSDPVHFQAEGVSVELPQELPVEPSGKTTAQQVAELIGPGPWWSGLIPGVPSYLDILKGGTRLTRKALCKLGFSTFC